MFVPKFKGKPGRKGDNWRLRPLATILLNKPTRFIRHHRSLDNKTLVPVNLGDKTKTCWLKNQTPLIQFQRLTKFESHNRPARLVDKADKFKTDVGLCKPANETNSTPT
jgi:hypothetical protein